MEIEIRTNTARGVWELSIIREPVAVSDRNYHQELDHYPTEVEILKAIVQRES
jgi:hypothetical protein